MLRTTLASSRVLRACALGLTATTAAIIFTNGTAEARHYRTRHHYAARHHEEARDSYSPQFASIIVDANSGATLVMAGSKVAGGFAVLAVCNSASASVGSITV